MDGRYALLIANSVFEDLAIPDLKTPPHNLDRLIASSILEKRRFQKERYYAIRSNPSQYEQAFWKYNGVDILPIEFETFIKKLTEASGS